MSGALLINEAMRRLVYQQGSTSSSTGPDDRARILEVTQLTGVLEHRTAPQD